MFMFFELVSNIYLNISTLKETTLLMALEMARTKCSDEIGILFFDTVFDSGI